MTQKPRLPNQVVLSKRPPKPQIMWAMTLYDANLEEFHCGTTWRALSTLGTSVKLFKRFELTVVDLARGKVYTIKTKTRYSAFLALWREHYLTGGINVGSVCK